MRKTGHIVFLLLLIVAFGTGCNDKKKKLNQRVTLWRKDKIPYGTFYAFENLKYIFPKAEINVNRSSPADFSFFQPASYNQNSERKDGRAGYIIIGYNMDPDERELNALLNFVGSGNQVFISAFSFGDSLLSRLNVKLAKFQDVPALNGNMSLSIEDPFTGDSMHFQYPGLAWDDAAIQIDSQYTYVLGKDRRGRPDFIKFGYKGGGAIFLHFAPLAFSNFFLLHKNNKTYYDLAMSYMSPSITEIKWDDYYRYPRNSQFSSFQYILRERSLRWAFWLTLLLFGIVYIVESKRRQRLIPVKPLLRNSSLDFVKTIGRLYYQRRDNGNLAAKMSTHFLDHVRTRYNISTYALNEDFIDRLSYKSGYDREELGKLIGSIETLPNDPQLDDETLLNFSKQLDAFYKKA